MQREKVKRLLATCEQGLIPMLGKHEVNPGPLIGSHEDYLYFTLPVCINFQCNSPAMWVAALAAWEDKITFIWTTIANAFHDHYPDDPRKLIEEAGNDAGQLSNYWPILSLYTDVSFTNSQVHPALWHWSRNKFQPEALP